MASPPRDPPPAGIYVPVPTFFTSSPSSYSSSSSPIRASEEPFKATAALDLPTQAAHALHLARAGIRGLVLLGSTGEAVHVSLAERAALLGGVRAALDGEGYADYPLIAGTAAQTVDEVVEQLAQARDAGGIQWGLVLVPGFFAGAGAGASPSAGQEGIFQWVTEVADRSVIPILVYHYPGVTNNVKLLPSTMARLSQHPNIVGCKLSHGDLSHTAQIAASPQIEHARFRTFTGLGQQLLPVLCVGGAGAIDGAAGFFPRALVRLWELGTRLSLPDAAATAEARALQYKVSAVEELVVRFGTIGIKEAIHRVLGLGIPDATRLPLYGGLPGGDAEWEQWKTVISDLAEVEAALGGGRPQ